LPSGDGAFSTLPHLQPHPPGAVIFLQNCRICRSSAADKFFFNPLKISKLHTRRFTLLRQKSHGTGMSAGTTGGTSILVVTNAQPAISAWQGQHSAKRAKGAAKISFLLWHRTPPVFDENVSFPYANRSYHLCL